MNPILAASELVMQQARFVSINEERLQYFAASYLPVHSRHWLRDVPFNWNRLSPENIANFLLLFYSLIFCFWGEPKWTIEYQGNKYDGSFGLLIALKRAYEQGKPILDWHFWEGISQEEFAEILAGNVEIPLLAERLTIVHEVGMMTNKLYQSQASNLIKACGKDARKLLALTAENYPSFRDVSIYNGVAVPFYKRSQLWVIDIFHFFDGQGLGELEHTDIITALADYKVPQSLRHFGMITYVPELASLVDSKTELTYNSPPEVEIRAANVWSIELLRRFIAKTMPNITSSDINDYLWLLSQSAEGMAPYHRCRNVFY